VSGFLANLGLLSLLLSGLYLVSLVVSKRDSIGLLLLSMPILVMWENPNDIYIATFTGFRVYYGDLLTLILVTVTLIKKWPLKLSFRFIGFHFMSIFILASIAAGLVNLSVSTTVVESRGSLLFLAAIWWGASVDWQKSNSKLLGQWLALFVLSLYLVALYHGIRTGLGNADIIISDLSSGSWQTSRILTSPQSIALLLASLTYVFLPDVRNKWFFMGVTSLVILLSQQRTTWAVAVLFLVSALILLQRRALYLVTMIFAFLLSALLIQFFGKNVVSTLTESATSLSTFGARSDSWVQIIQPAFEKGIEVILFGSPFGSGFLRFLQDGSYATYNPHNFYVFLFMRTGILGLSAFLVPVIWMVLRASRLRDGLTLLISLGCLLYSFTYNLDFVWGLFIGIAITRIRANKTRHLDETPDR